VYTVAYLRVNLCKACTLSTACYGNCTRIAPERGKATLIVFCSIAKVNAHFIRRIGLLDGNHKTGLGASFKSLFLGELAESNIDLVMKSIVFRIIRPEVFQAI